jgi:proline racemase
VPSFAGQLDAPLEVKGLGSLKVDIAYGGDSFVIVDAVALGFAVQPDEARDLSELGIRIIAAANEQLGFSHPEAGGWDHISFCQFAGPLTRQGNELRGRNAVVVRPGKIDRSPTGTGCSARMATLRARADGEGRRLSRPIHHRVGVRLPHRAPDRDRVPAGHRSDYFRPGLDYRREPVYVGPADPWPLGYRLADTWPRTRGSI